jgi:AcrR family transcriptional regulator
VPTTRKPRADGERTREAIVREAVSLATLDGLDGLSIGNLADKLEMSKSGVYAHFGSKQELQLATLDEAGKIFVEEVIDPALAAEPPGLAQLVALCDAFFDHLLRRTLPGGCFWCGVVVEMGTRPGRVRDQITAFQGALIALMRDLIVTAIEAGDLPDGDDPDALAFELSGVMFAANANFVLRDDTGAVEMARGIVRRRLGVADESRAPRESYPA